MSSPLPEPTALPPPRPARGPAGVSDRGARWVAGIAFAAAAVAIGLAWNAQQALSSLSQSAGGKLADLGSELAQSKTNLAQAQVALKDSQARILTAGLLGDQYIGLEPGGDTANLVAGDTVKQTQSAVVLENLIGQFLFNKAADAGAGAPKP